MQLNFWPDMGCQIQNHLPRHLHLSADATLQAAAAYYLSSSSSDVSEDAKGAHAAPLKAGREPATGSLSSDTSKQHRRRRHRKRSRDDAGDGRKQACMLDDALPVVSPKPCHTSWCAPPASGKFQALQGTPCSCKQLCQRELRPVRCSAGASTRSRRGRSLSRTSPLRGAQMQRRQAPRCLLKSSRYSTCRSCEVATCGWPSVGCSQAWLQPKDLLAPSDPAPGRHPCWLCSTACWDRVHKAGFRHSTASHAALPGLPGLVALVLQNHTAQTANNTSLMRTGGQSQHRRQRHKHISNCLASADCGAGEAGRSSRGHHAQQPAPVGINCGHGRHS